MGVTETLGQGREVARDRPGAVVVALFVLILFVDLLLKLAGVEIGFLGGNLRFRRLTSNLWDGLTVGLLVGLAGIGLSMTYSILTFANFSHGDLVTAGGFTGWGVAYVIAGWGAAPIGVLLLVRPGGGLSPGEVGAHVINTPAAIFAGLIVAAVATAIIALVIDRLVYRPMRDRSGIALLIASIGVALALRYLIQFMYGARRRGVTATVDGGNLDLYFTILNIHKVTLVICAVILMILTHLLLQRTKLGTAMRAMADNRDLALITGIPTERVVTATWLVGGGLAGAAGYLTVLSRGVIAFDFGWLLLLLIFAAVILGGIGSIYGAIFGGIIIGIVWAVSIIWIPSDFNEAAAFAAMILVLLFRPEGLFGGITTA